MKTILALAYYKSDRVKAAVSICSRLLKNSPRYSYARSTLAKCLIKKGEFIQALKVLGRCVSDPEGNHLRGICYYRLGKCRLAKEAVQSAIAMDKDKLCYRNNLAVLEEYA